MSMAIQSAKIPKEFIFRRLHSLMGFWFLLFLMEHLFTNSQAGIYFINHENWFVKSVDFLQNLPYLHFIEVGLLGIPILYHAAWGIIYMFSSKSNAFHSNGTLTHIKTTRNKAYTLQRMSAWVLALGIILHVAQMRFFEYPHKYQNKYYAPIEMDMGLYDIANRLNVELYSQESIEKEKVKLSELEQKMELVQLRFDEKKKELSHTNEYDQEMGMIYETLQKRDALREHVKGLESKKLGKDEVMCVSKSFGNLELLNVRETFRSPILCILYTIFVVAAVFHGFNGLWTFLITWGLILSNKAQSSWVNVSYGLMFVLGVLGMLSIWGTYFLG
jgi:succinate dehydrogenase / fumarate reductase cytochrome b subunit